MRAYPRVCGATFGVAAFRLLCQGLSPRMRGNRLQKKLQVWLQGPIPAYAGQPRHRCTATPAPRAYPRVCGATHAWLIAGCVGVGLSPRMRGNLRAGGVSFGWVGPIPAYAGQPSPE